MRSVGMSCSLITAALAGPSLCLQFLFRVVYSFKHPEGRGELRVGCVHGEGQSRQCKPGSEITQDRRCGLEEVKPEC